jgi:hypothetical protein
VESSRSLEYRERGREQRQDKEEIAEIEMTQTKRSADVYVVEMTTRPLKPTTNNPFCNDTNTLPMSPETKQKNLLSFAFVNFCGGFSLCESVN